MVRKVVVSDCISLDGFFEGTHGEIDWFIIEDSFNGYSREVLNEAEMIIMGRKTYERMAAYWPGAAEEDAVITHKMNHLPKIVFSDTLDQTSWNNSRVVKGEMVREFLKLKDQPGKDILILGSGSLVKELTREGLIDEYRLVLMPVILGGGNPLFDSRRVPVALRLIRTRVLSSGAVILYYGRDRDL